MSGVTKAAKFSQHDRDLLEWMAAQPEGDSQLIKLALYRLMDARLNGETPTAALTVETVEPVAASSGAPFDMDQFVAALASALVDALPTATPPPALDLDKLADAITQGIQQGNANLAATLEQAVRDGLQGVVIVPAGDAEPERLDEDGQKVIDHPGLLDEMLAGMDSWMQ